MSTITCTECGHINQAESSYCDNCGRRLTVIKSPEEDSLAAGQEFDNNEDVIAATDEDVITPETGEEEVIAAADEDVIQPETEEEVIAATDEDVIQPETEEEVIMATDEDVIQPSETEEEVIMATEEVIPPSETEEEVIVATEEEVIPPETEEEVIMATDEDVIQPSETEEEVIVATEEEVIPPQETEEEVIVATEEEVIPPETEEEVVAADSTMEMEREEIGSQLEAAWLEDENKDEEQELETVSEQEKEKATFQSAREAIPANQPTRLDYEQIESEPPITAPATTLDIREPILTLIHNESGQKFILPSNAETIYIGRLNEDIPVDVDLSKLPNADVVSRVHCSIHNDFQGYYIEDAGSINGTFLNNEEIKTGARYRKELKSGDLITLGRNRQVKLTFKVET